ncbi:hypothetical protein [Marinomonas sp. THO17]|uniref:hypothetical protein n=1 Tax=Marinomonas sp. THO17 TaxID=3149048 RepID=UPI00336BFFB8
MKITYLIFTALLLVGCDSGALWEDKPYQVLWIDVTDNRTLNYDLGDGGSITRIKAKIIAVGSNDHYIVAKQKEPDTDAVAYYYIEKDNDDKFANGASGPYSEVQFLELKKKFDLPEFTKTFK